MRKQGYCQHITARRRRRKMVHGAGAVVLRPTFFPFQRPPERGASFPAWLGAYSHFQGLVRGLFLFSDVLLELIFIRYHAARAWGQNYHQLFFRLAPIYRAR